MIINPPCRAESIVSQGTEGELLCPDVRCGQVISNTRLQTGRQGKKLNGSNAAPRRGTATQLLSFIHR